MEARIVVREMGKTRGDANRTVHIKIPRLDVRKGEFVAVIGTNGSGKSTLLDMLGLLLSPDQVETYELNGPSRVDLRRPTRSEILRIRRRHFAYVLQTGGLLEFLSLRENIRLAGRIGGKADKEIDTGIRKIGELLGIGDVLDKRPGKVSGGQRQKAAIARALIRAPDIILADEPTAAMDTPSAARLMKTFREMTTNAGTSLILVTHDVERVRDLADAVYHFAISEDGGGELISVLQPENGHFPAM